MKKYEAKQEHKIPDLIAQDGKSYNVWSVSDGAGFYLEEHIKGADAAELLGRIADECAALKAQMESAMEKAETDAQEESEALGSVPTEIFDELKNEAEESLALKNGTRALEETLPYLIRERTGEKIMIHKNIFKLGKDAEYVDYFVDGNPTISRNHADLIRKGDGFYVRDKGSLNHTFIDGKKLEPEKPEKLKPGSYLQLSDEVFAFVYDK